MNLASIQAVILLGGKGTRLAALHPDIPKALVPVAGRPFLEWQLLWLARGGIQSVHLAAGHLVERIEAWAIATPLAADISITVSREPQPLGTAGALRHIEERIASDPFLVLNGDSLTPSLDFQTLETLADRFSNHWKNPPQEFPMFGKPPPKSFQCLENPTAPLAAIAVAPIEEAGRYGTVEFDEDGTVRAFREKAERSGGWVNAGVYLMSRRALDAIPPDTNVSIETEVFPALAERRRLLAFPVPPPLLDMGTPDGLAAMTAHLRA